MRMAAAVDIGGTSTKIGIVGEDGRITERATIPTSAAGDPLPLMDAIASTLRPMLDALGEGATLERPRDASAPDAGERDSDGLSGRQSRCGGRAAPICFFAAFVIIVVARTVAASPTGSSR